MEPLAEAVAVAVSRLDDLPRAFFGHSLGAWIAYEVAARIGAVRLIASGSGGPAGPRPSSRIHTLPEEEFRAAVGGMNGTPPEVLNDEELMTLVGPALRADLELHETYVAPPRAPLDCPVTVFAAEHDEVVAASAAAAWAQATRGPFSLKMFAGGHFFLKDSQEMVLEAIAAEFARSEAR